MEETLGDKEDWIFFFVREIFFLNWIEEDKSFHDDNSQVYYLNNNQTYFINDFGVSFASAFQ